MKWTSRQLADRETDVWEITWGEIRLKRSESTFGAQWVYWINKAFHKLVIFTCFRDQCGHFQKRPPPPKLIPPVTRRYMSGSEGDRRECTRYHEDNSSSVFLCVSLYSATSSFSEYYSSFNIKNCSRLISALNTAALIWFFADPSALKKIRSNQT